MVTKVYYASNDLAAAGGQPAQPRPDAASLKCPRCDSFNTKFCYYNNYSLAQPRHFCKACKRYWTLGGTLRNVPVGGGCRKNKRHKKPQSTPPPKAPVRQIANSLPVPAAELCSLMYGTQSTNSTDLFFPGFHVDAQFSRHEETFPSGIRTHLADLKLSTVDQPPMLCYDYPDLGLSRGLDLTSANPFGGSGSVGAESSHLDWDPAGVSSIWPEYSSSAAAPLL